MMATVENQTDAVKLLGGYIGNSLKQAAVTDESVTYEYLIAETDTPTLFNVMYGFTYSAALDIEDQVVTSEETWIPVIEAEITAPFKKISYVSNLKNINKGSKNKITVKPTVLIENMNDDTNSLSELGTGGITDVGQVFRLTSGIFNLARVHLTLEATAGAGITIVEDFESYADTTALRVVWVPNDTTNSPNTLETSIVSEGTQAMKMDLLNKQKSKNDTFIKTYASVQDWSMSDGIQFQFRKNTAFTIEFHIEDSAGNSSKHSVSTSGTGSFELIQLSFNNFSPVGASPADLTDVKKIKFFVKSVSSIGACYVDIMELFSSASFGTVDLELYDFGTDSAPTSLGSPILTETFNVSANKQTYEIEFEKESLTPNNYYGLVITNASASNIKVYGKSGSNKYASGFAFDSTDNGTNIAATGANDDCYFLTFAVDKAIFNGIRLNANTDTGNSTISIFINDNASSKGKTALFLNETFLGRTEIDFPTGEQAIVRIKMKKEELLFLEYDDDSASQASRLNVIAYFTFIDRSVHG